MKAIEHVKQLLEQGKRRKQLLELGFTNSAITRAKRVLRKEKLTTKSNNDSQKGSEIKEKVSALWKKSSGENTSAGIPENMREMYELVSPLSLLKTRIDEVGSLRRGDCGYFGEGGICCQRSWEKKEDMPQTIGEPIFSDEDMVWLIKPHPVMCAFCTATLREHIEYFQDLEKTSPFTDFKNRFQCAECGGKELLAVKVKCTRCGHEDYWGWFPEK